jgi:hypothetical protein
MLWSQRKRLGRSCFSGRKPRSSVFSGQTCRASNVVTRETSSGNTDQNSNCPNSDGRNECDQQWLLVSFVDQKCVVRQDAAHHGFLAVP